MVGHIVTTVKLIPVGTISDIVKCARLGTERDFLLLLLLLLHEDTVLLLLLQEKQKRVTIATTKKGLQLVGHIGGWQHHTATSKGQWGFLPLRTRPTPKNHSQTTQGALDWRATAPQAPAGPPG